MFFFGKIDATCQLSNWFFDLIMQQDDSSRLATQQMMPQDNLHASDLKLGIAKCRF